MKQGPAIHAAGRNLLVMRPLLESPGWQMVDKEIKGRMATLVNDVFTDDTLSDTVIRQKIAEWRALKYAAEIPQTTIQGAESVLEQHKDELA